MNTHRTGGQTRPASARPSSPLLRKLALLLAVCCAWSFAGSSILVAAVPAPQVLAAKRSALVLAHGSYPPPVFLSSAISHPQPVNPAPLVASPTLLDKIGHLAQPVSADQPPLWKRELRTARPKPTRAAILHLWMGEYLLAHDEQPEQAEWHFRRAQNLSPPGDDVYGLAAYDVAVAQFYAGAYLAASHSFLRLLSPKTSLSGYDHRTCALWYRHLAPCGIAMRRPVPVPTTITPNSVSRSRRSWTPSAASPPWRPRYVRSTTRTTAGRFSAPAASPGKGITFRIW